MTQEAHTPTPWYLGENTVGKQAVCSDGWVLFVNDSALLHPKGKANARRIVACVNGLAGIPIGAIESGVVAELIEAARGALAALLKSEARNSKGAKKLAETLAKIGGAS